MKSNKEKVKLVNIKVRASTHKALKVEQGIRQVKGDDVSFSDIIEERLK